MAVANFSRARPEDRCLVLTGGPAAPGAVTHSFAAAAAAAYAARSRTAMGEAKTLRLYLSVLGYVRICRTK